MDFIKPGKHTFCVRSPQSDQHGDSNIFFVHKLLAKNRTEDIPRSKYLFGGNRYFSLLVVKLLDFIRK